jgi:hemolysin activation/secretion protein
MNTFLRLSAVCLFAPAAFTLAQTAKVLGPQSPIEQYRAPVPDLKSTEGLIDFPKLIAAPGANDGQQITPALTAFNIEFVGSGPSSSAAEQPFIRFVGHSRVPEKKREALYAAIVKRLSVHRDLALTLGDARIIQQDINEVYRDAGFPLMSVVVPPQEIVGGQLRIQINEFSLQAYRVQYADGEGGYRADAPHRSNDARLKRILDPLLAEPVLSQESLDKKVKRLNAGPYRSARVVFEPGQDVGQSVAQIQIDEKRPWSLQAGYNNFASKSSGTDRYSLGGAFWNPLFEDHQFSWNATTGNHIEEFQNYSLNYIAPTVPGQRLTVSTNYSDTASSTIPGIPGSASTTLQSSLKYELPIWERENFQWGANAALSFNNYHRESLFGSVLVGSADYDAVQLAFNSIFNWKETTATNQFTAGVVFNFAGITPRNSAANFRQFYNTPTGDPVTQHYLLNYARVQQLAPLADALDGWSTETQISAQLTADQLAGGDNFSIGGSNVLRAYQSSEVSGDTGAYIVQFLHIKPLSGDNLGVAQKWIQQVAFSPFIEAGTGHFENGGEDHIWDYGVQVAVAANKYFSATASYAIAGQGTLQTGRNDGHFYVSCSVAY